MHVSTRKLAHIACLIWLLAAGVRLVLVFGLDRKETGRHEIQKVALTLLNEGYLGNPYAVPTGPTAHTAPAYPLLQAAFYAVFGDSARTDDIRVVFTICLAALEYALLPLLSRRLALGDASGIAAGFAGALIPLQFWGESFGVFENTLSALFLLLFTLAAAPALTGGVGRAPRRAWTWGVAAGLGALISPTLLPAVLAAAALAYVRVRPPLRSAAIACAFCALTVAPWTLRNWMVFQQFIPVRSNFGLELAVSNYDGARPDAESNLLVPYFLQTHPYSNATAARHIAEVGEPAYHREMLHRATSWIETHPAAFAKLTLERGLAFWFMNSRHLWHRTALALVPLLALAAICVLARQAHPAAALLFFVPLSYSLIFLLVQNHIRYQHPVWWALWLAAWILPARAFEDRVLKSKLPR